MYICQNCYDEHGLFPDTGTTSGRCELCSERGFLSATWDLSTSDTPEELAAKLVAYGRRKRMIEDPASPLRRHIRELERKSL